MGRLGRWVLVGGAALALATVGLVVAPSTVNAVPSCTGTSTVTCTFSSTGASESFTVPAAVTQVSVDAFGAEGGHSQDGTNGGKGGEATATFAVTPGEVLQVNVGGQPATGNPASGGFNGGGPSGTGTPAAGITPNAGGGGGGASDVRQGGTALANRVVVAGGGGGGGGSTGSCTGGTGGGTNGGDGSSCNSGDQGHGGTPIGGGQAGNCGFCTAGSAGQGGTGDTGPGFGGGGGGGGNFGGGGAAGSRSQPSDGGGGGGGSGLTPSGAGMTNGVRTGNGLITITYTPGSPQLSATALNATTVQVTGSNYPLNTAVTVTIQSAPVVLGTVTTTAAGAFSATFTVPCSVGAGAHTITGTATGGASATAGVTLPACPVTATPRFTG